MNGCMKLYEESRKYVGPVLHAYVHWVLRESQKRGIKTLYFLARDGYVLREIAKMQCKAENIEISCRYLYCSRASLRMPAYHLIGDEAYDQIFMNGYRVSVSSFLLRAGIPRTEWDQIMKESGITENTDQVLAYSRIAACRQKLLMSRTFKQCVEKNSKECYPAAAGYLMQEGLAGQEHLAVVDSGWTGSMQRSLRQLLENEGFKGKITGFYFGLFRKSLDVQDGEYLSWYFSPEKDKKNKVFFCNNLLECFLAAPHGMTVSYEKRQEEYFPCLMESSSDARHEEERYIRQQVMGILAGAAEQQDSGIVLTKAQCGSILRRIMSRPLADEVKIYGRFSFCDDITEDYHDVLAGRGHTAQLKNTLLPVCAVRKMMKRSHRHAHPQLFWTFGTIALVKNPLKRSLYWLNESLCQWLRMTIKTE